MGVMKSSLHAAIENEMQQDQVDSFVGSCKTTYIIGNLEYDPTVTDSLYLTSKATNDYFADRENIERKM